MRVFFLSCFISITQKFYRYHEMLSEKEKEKNRRLGANVNARPPYWKIFKEAFPQLLNVFLIFFVTLSVFPAVHSEIKPIEDGALTFNGKSFWISITCFLTFNVFAMLGSLTTSWIQWPSRKYLVFPVLLRFLFIPLFLFCNYLPATVTRGLPVYITSDLAYWIIAVLMSYSSGYLR